MKTSIILILSFLFPISGSSQEIFHKIASDGKEVLNIPADCKGIHPDSNYIIFKSGSYSCNQYTTYHKQAWDLAQQTKSGFILLFDDNEEDTSFYMEKYYNHPDIEYKVIIDRKLYKQLDIKENSYSVSFIEKGIIKRKCDVVQLLNIKVPNSHKDSVELDIRFTDISTLLMLNDSLLLNVDPSTNQSVQIINLNKGLVDTKLNLNDKKYSWLVDTMYAYLIQNKLTDLKNENYRTYIKNTNDSNMSLADDSEFALSLSNSQPLLSKNDIFLNMVFYYYPEKELINFLYPIFVTFKLDFNLNIIDYYIVPTNFKLDNGNWSIKGLSGINQDRMIYEISDNDLNEEIINYKGRRFCEFRFAQKHRLKPFKMFQFQMPSFKPVLCRGLFCGEPLKLINNDKVLIYDVPFLYSLEKGNTTDTLSPKFSRIDTMYNANTCCVSGLEYYSIPTDMDGVLIYKVENDNRQIDLLSNENKSRRSLIFSKRKYNQVLGYFTSVFYFYDKINVDGKDRKFVYKQKIELN